MPVPSVLMVNPSRVILLLAIVTAPIIGLPNPLRVIGFESVTASVREPGPT